MAERRELSVLVIGKSGVGKSTVCNKLLLRPEFPLSRRLERTVTSAAAGKRTVNSRGETFDLKVIDTPDLFSLAYSGREVQHEIQKIRKLLTAGPTVVLLVVRCDLRYTQEDINAYQGMRSKLGGMVSNNLVLAFTNGEQLVQSVDIVVNKAGPYLQQVFAQAGRRHVIFYDSIDGDQVGQILEYSKEIEKANSWGSLGQAALTVGAICLVLLFGAR